jgi:hypothetical protein
MAIFKFNRSARAGASKRPNKTFRFAVPIDRTQLLRANAMVACTLATIQASDSHPNLRIVSALVAMGLASWLFTRRRPSPDRCQRPPLDATGR